jgi:hypothetical protein
MQQIQIKQIAQAKIQTPVLEKSTTRDAHDALFDNENTQSAPPKTLQELKQGIEQYIKNKHSRQ